MEHTITTPENVQFHYSLAGLGSRGAAAGIDFMVLVVVATVLAMIGGTLSVVSGAAGTAASILLPAMFWFGYGPIAEWRGGQTLGKRLLGLRVVAESGQALTLSQALVRNLLWPVDILPGLGLVAAISAMVGARPRRIGDWFAGTMVVHEALAPRPERLVSTLAGAERAPLRLGVAERKRVGPADRELLLDLCLRRDQLEPGVRAELFTDVATHWRDVLGRERDPNISDERWVLLLCSAVFEDGGREREDDRRAPVGTSAAPGPSR